jgi:pentatricopeptide repeat protein
MNSLMSMYLKCGDPLSVIDVWHKLLKANLQPTQTSLVVILQACGDAADFKCGDSVYQYILHNNIEGEVMVETALVQMFVKCMQTGKALDLWQEMISTHRKLDPKVYGSILSACAEACDFDVGKVVYEYFLSSDVELTTLLGNGILNMQNKCGMILEAQQTFDKLWRQNLADVVSWNSIINGMNICL